MNLSKHEVLLWLLRIIFGGMLIYASIEKIISPLDFAQLVENYQIVGPRTSRWIAVGLPYLELIVGILLITGFWLDSAVVLNFLMMSVFLIAVTQAYLRGLDIRCGCFSSEGSEINPGKIAFNMFLFIGSAILLKSGLLSTKTSGTET